MNDLKSVLPEFIIGKSPELGKVLQVGDKVPNDERLSFPLQVNIVLTLKTQMMLPHTASSKCSSSVRETLRMSIRRADSTLLG